jgi:hypothetical protein
MKKMLLLVLAGSALALAGQGREQGVPSQPGGARVNRVTRVTQPGTVTRLFDTADSGRACGDASYADWKANIDAEIAATKGGYRSTPTKGTGEEICEAGTIANLAPSTRVSVVRMGEEDTPGRVSYSLVRVVAGKNAGKEGWIATGSLTIPEPESKTPPKK